MTASGSLRLAAATLIAAIAGAATGTSLADGGSDPRSEARAPGTALVSGVARLPLPAGWEPLHRRSSLPGLYEATAVRGVRSDVALDIRAPENPSLLPAAVVAASFAEFPEPRLEVLGGRKVWRYELPGDRPTTAVVALALPTTRAVVTIACQAETAAIAAARAECEHAMRALELEGASELAPAPETAARIVLPSMVAGLNRERRSGRRVLAATQSARIRGEAARRVARAYLAVADRLRPLAGGEARRLVVACAEMARRHDALAIAGERRDAAAARRAAAAIERGERRLTPLLAAVARRATEPAGRTA